MINQSFESLVVFICKHNTFLLFSILFQCCILYKDLLLLEFKSTFLYYSYSLSTQCTYHGNQTSLYSNILCIDIHATNVICTRNKYHLCISLRSIYIFYTAICFFLIHMKCKQICLVGSMTSSPHISYCFSAFVSSLDIQFWED